MEETVVDLTEELFTSSESFKVIINMNWATLKRRGSLSTVRMPFIIQYRGKL